MRPEVEISGEIRKKVEKFAKKKGLRLPWAYGELIEAGLKEKGFLDEQSGGR